MATFGSAIAAFFAPTAAASAFRSICPLTGTTPTVIVRGRANLIDSAMASEDLERLATDAEPDVMALKGWRRTLFGEAALKLKRGELALTLVKGEVRAVSSNGNS